MSTRWKKVVSIIGISAMLATNSIGVMAEEAVDGNEMKAVETDSGQPEDPSADDQSGNSETGEQSQDTTANDEPDNPVTDDKADSGENSGQPGDSENDDQSGDGEVNDKSEDAAADDKSENEGIDDKPGDTTTDDKSEDSAENDSFVNEGADDKAEVEESDGKPEDTENDKSEDGVTADKPEDTTTDNNSEGTTNNDESEDAITDEKQGDVVTDEGIATLAEPDNSSEGTEAAIPTELGWSDTYKGMAKFKHNAGDVRNYYVELYKDGELISKFDFNSYTSNEYWDINLIGTPFYDFENHETIYHTDRIVESGIYQYRLKLKESNETSDDFSEGKVSALSSEYQYTRPDEKLPAPQNLRWSDTGVLEWDAVAEDAMYWVALNTGAITSARGTKCDLTSYIIDDKTYVVAVYAMVHKDGYKIYSDYSEAISYTGGGDDNKPGTGEDDNKPGTGEDDNKPGTGGEDDNKPDTGEDEGEDAGIPTELGWSIIRGDIYAKFKHNQSFENISSTAVEYYIEVYKDGELIWFNNMKDTEKLYTADEYGDEYGVICMTNIPDYNFEKHETYNMGYITESGTYKYRLKMKENYENPVDFSQGKVSEFSSEYSYIQPEKLSTPQNVRMSNTGVLSWDAVKGATYYRIEGAMEGASYPSYFTGRSETNYDFRGDGFDSSVGSYVFVVCAEGVKDGCTVYSDYSAEVSHNFGGTGDDDNKPGTGGDNNKPGTGDDSSKPGTGDDDNKPGTGDDDNKPGTGDDDNKPGTGDDDNNKPGTGDDDNKPDTGDDDNNKPGTGGDNNKPGTGDDSSKPGTGDDNNKPSTGDDDNNKPGTGADNNTSSNEGTENKPSTSSSSRSSSSSSSTSSSTVTAPKAKAPMIGKSEGWSSLGKVVNEAIARKAEGTDAVVWVKLNDAELVPASALRGIAGKDVTVCFETKTGVIVNVNGRLLTPSAVGEIKIISNKGKDGSTSLKIRNTVPDMNQAIVIFAKAQTGAQEKILYFVDATNQLIPFRTSNVETNGYAAFEVPFVNANYVIGVSQ